MDVEICLDLTQESIEYSAIWQDCNVILYDYTTFIFYTFLYRKFVWNFCRCHKMLLKLARHFYRTKALRTQEMEGVPEEKGMTLRHRCFIEKESLKSRNHKKSSEFLSSKEICSKRFCHRGVLPPWPAASVAFGAVPAALFILGVALRRFRRIGTSAEDVKLG